MVAEVVVELQVQMLDGVRARDLLAKRGHRSAAGLFSLLGNCYCVSLLTSVSFSAGVVFSWLSAGGVAGCSSGVLIILVSIS